MIRNLNDWSVSTSIKPFKFFMSLHKDVKCAFDFDGVLCEECPSDKRGNDLIYEEFLENVEPLYRPVMDDIIIITGRHEKYRKLTRLWLAKHGISYSQLIMRDFPLEEGKSWFPDLARHKAQHCIDLGLDMFIESRYNQAVIIANTTKKPVLCTAPFGLIKPSEEPDTENSHA